MSSRSLSRPESALTRSRHNPNGNFDERPYEISYHQPTNDHSAPMPIELKNLPPRVYIPTGAEGFHFRNPRPARHAVGQQTDLASKGQRGVGRTMESLSSEIEAEPQFLDHDPLDEAGIHKINGWIGEHEKFIVGSRQQPRRDNTPLKPPQSDRTFVKEANNELVHGVGLARREERMSYRHQVPDDGEVIGRDRRGRRDARRGRGNGRTRSRSQSSDTQSFLTKLHNCGGYC